MSEEKKNDLNENNSSNINNDLSKSNEEMLSNNNNNNDNNNNNNDNNNNNNNNNNNINSLNNKNTSFNTSNSKSKEKKDEKLKQNKQFDILIINTELNKLKENECYKDKNDNLFMYNNKDKNSEKYYASITLNEGLSEFKYIGGLGIFDSNLKQQGFGYLEYEKDKYIGNWEQDLKNGFGIYAYEKNKKNEKNINNFSNNDSNDFYSEEIYIGNWENDLKKGKGIYIFKKHKEEDISKGNYDFLFGNFEDDKFQYGYIISKKDNSKIIYKGKINENGEKNDEESFYFENFNNDIKNDNNINNKSIEEIDNEKKGFFGEFKNNIMNKGRIIIFDENNSSVINSQYYFEKIDDEYKFDLDKYNQIDNKLKEIKLNIEKEDLQNNLINKAYKFCIDLIPQVNEIDKIKKFEINKDFNDKFEKFLQFKIENMNDNL